VTPSSPGPSRGFGALVGALRIRWKVGAGGAANIVLPLQGGAGAFLTRSAARRLVTTTTLTDTGAPTPGLAGRLERRQARRSAVLVVPDRPSGVAIALRWGLNPERLRLAGPEGSAGLDSISVPGGSTRWHSRR
jgi:hypothetical protein